MTHTRTLYDDGILAITTTPGGFAMAGEIARSEHAPLGKVLGVLIERRGADVAHLDLSAVRSCDVAGLKAILSLISPDHMLRLGGSADVVPARLLTLHDPPAYLRTMLHTLGWDTLPGLTISDSTVPEPRGTRGDGGVSEPAASVPTAYSFRLYVSGSTKRSHAALTNLRLLCAGHAPDHHAIEIIDTLERPDLAAQANVLATPTVVRLAPLPQIRVIGDLSDHDRATACLGLPTTGIYVITGPLAR